MAVPVPLRGDFDATVGRANCECRSNLPHTGAHV